MSTQKEDFAFCAEHSTKYEPGRKHGHTWELTVETSWRGDHHEFRRVVIAATLETLNKSHLDEIHGLDKGEGGTGEAVADWIWEQLEATKCKPVSVEVTELSASDSHHLARHTKRRTR